MKFSEMFSNFSSKKHTINGRNLEYSQDLNFNHLYMMEGLTPEQREYVVNFQNRFEMLYDMADSTTTTPLVIENGQIPNGTLVHRCYLSVDRLRSISQSGIMASEWFGIEESEREAPFCTFLTEKMDFEHPMHAKIHDASFIPNPGEICLYFDSSNELMQDLLSVDYFEYSAKKLRGEDLSEYPPVIREFYDNVIDAKSCKFGKNMHMNPSFRNAWRAIPGGIPAKLVNGIGIHSSKATPELLDELGQLFPYATIYNEKFEVLRPALIQQKDTKMDIDGPEKSE